VQEGGKYKEYKKRKKKMTKKKVTRIKEKKSWCLLGGGCAKRQTNIYIQNNENKCG
jgi:hypothetical protein